MKVQKDLILDNEFKLKISPKRLASGRYQVKFYATIQSEKEVYGYLLAESGETLKAVIDRIKRRLRKMNGSGEFGFFELNPTNTANNTNQMMIFHA